MNDELLRAGLLEGITAVVAGATGGPYGDAAARRCESLGASVVAIDVADMGEEETIATRLAALRADSGRVDVLVNDGASLFARGGGELTALRACLDGCWRAIQAVANGAFIGDGGEGPGGRIVNLAPAPGAGAHAGAARAGLENLARTLSIEWARHGIVTTTIAPADSSEPEAIARLVAFLASPAGGYYSGCVFTLDALA